MKRIVNVRPLFLIFVFLILGVLSFNFCTTKNLFDSLYSLLSMFFIFAVLIVFICLIFKWDLLRQKLAIFYKNRFNILVGVLSFVLGFVVMFGFTTYYKHAIKNLNGAYEIIGEITDNIIQTDSYTMFTIKDAYVTIKDSAVKLKSNVKVITYSTGIVNDNAISPQNKITFTADVSTTPFVNDGYNYNNYLNNVAYFAKMSSNYSFDKGKYSIDEFIRDKYRKVLNENLTLQNASLAFSLVFGGSSGFEDELLNVFSISGLIHVISVSGFHIAVLIASISLLLKLLKISKTKKLIIHFVVLLFYSYLCGFVPTVVRSAIMGLIFLLAQNLGENYDGLNALSLSGIIIVLISPLSVYNIGFILSFVCIYGIFTVYPYINNSLKKKLKLPTFISSPVSLTLAVTILTLPITCYYFKQVATYSVISNLLIAPILTVAYVLVFAITTICIIVPFLSFLLVFPNILIHISILLLKLVVAMPYSYITLYSDGFISLIILLIFAFVLKYIMVNKKVKSAILFALASVFICLTIINNLPLTFNNAYAVTATNLSKGNACIITTNNNERVLIGVEFKNDKDYMQLIHNLKIKKINTVVAYDFKLNYLNRVQEICKKYNVENLVIISKISNEANFNINNTNVVVINNDEYFAFNGIIFNAIFDIDDMLALNVKINDKQLLFIKNTISKSKLSTLQYFASANYEVIFTTLKYNLTDYGFNTKLVVAFSNNETTGTKIKLMNGVSNFTYKI